MKARWARKGFKGGAIVVVAAAAAAVGFVVMGLWNWLAPEVFGLHPITFWQALGLLLLSKILFGFQGKPGWGGPWRRRMDGRWQRMTEEEREKFRRGMLSRCGGAGLEEESHDPRS